MKIEVEKYPEGDVPSGEICSIDRERGALFSRTGTISCIIVCDYSGIPSNSLECNVRLGRWDRHFLPVQIFHTPVSNPWGKYMYGFQENLD